MDKIEKLVRQFLQDKNVSEQYIMASMYGYRKANISAAKYSEINKKLFPNKGNTKTYIYILSILGLKHCTQCNEILRFESFRKNKATKSGLQAQCMSCQQFNTNRTQRSRQSKYRSAKIKRVPKWANKEKIKEIYDNCPKDCHVDHIIPLQGDLVSGLHVESNLQYLTAKENLQKGNKYGPLA